MRIALFFCLIFGLLSCSQNASSHILFKTNISDYAGQRMHRGETVKLVVEGREYDSVLVFLNGKLRPQAFELSQENSHYGINQLELVVYKGADKMKRGAALMVLPQQAPATRNLQVVATYPHNNENFTEGFIYENGVIYESTGLRGASKLEAYDLLTGKVKKVKKLDAEYFGEGIAKVGDSIYQLTYKAQKVFVYDVQSLEQRHEFSFPFSKEGWGLCYDGQFLIMSNGSHVLHFIDPQDFSLHHTLQVADAKGLRKNLNELEFHQGKIYANVWYENEIVIIDAVSGAVEEVLPIPELPDGLGRDDVANGIAMKDDNLLITGKNWPVIFELSLAENF